LLGIALHALYKICFLGLGQGRYLHEPNAQKAVSLRDIKIVLQGRKALCHEGQTIQKFVLEENGMGMCTVGHNNCRNNRYFGCK
jgi:hypothetical protein